MDEYLDDSAIIFTNNRQEKSTRLTSMDIIMSSIEPLIEFKQECLEFTNNIRTVPLCNRWDYSKWHDFLEYLIQDKARPIASDN